MTGAEMYKLRVHMETDGEEEERMRKTFFPAVSLTNENSRVNSTMHV